MTHDKRLRVLNCPFHVQKWQVNYNHNLGCFRIQSPLSLFQQLHAPFSVPFSLKLKLCEIQLSCLVLLTVFSSAVVGAKINDIYLTSPVRLQRFRVPRCIVCLVSQTLTWVGTLSSFFADCIMLGFRPIQSNSSCIITYLAVCLSNISRKLLGVLIPWSEFVTFVWVGSYTASQRKVHNGHWMDNGRIKNVFFEHDQTRKGVFWQL